MIIQLLTGVALFLLVAAVARFVGHAFHVYATEQEQYRDIERRHAARFNQPEKPNHE